MSSLEFIDLDKYLISHNGKIIHQIWFGTIPNKSEAKKAYKKLQYCVNSWYIQNPNWLRFEWNRENCMLLVKNFYPQHLDMFKNYKYEIQRCDAVRYMILHRYGGWYVDMDYFCNRPLDDVHEKYKNDIYFVQTPNKTFFQEDDYVSNSLMFSIPKHPFWNELLLHLEKNQKYRLYFSKHFVVMNTTGPILVNRVYSLYKYRYGLKSLPYKNFQPYGVKDFKTLKLPDDIYAVHMVKSSWTGKDSILINFILTDWKLLSFFFIIFILILIMYKI